MLEFSTQTGEPEGSASDTDMEARNPDGLLVLLVDDCKDTTLSTATLVRAWGHRAIIANNATEGLRLAIEGKPDVVILDILMPGMCGWELAHQLRQIPGLEATMLVALSGFGQPQDQARSREAGCDLHLTKPVEPEELEKLLAQIHTRLVQSLAMSKP